MAYDYSGYKHFTDINDVKQISAPSDGVYRIGTVGRKLDVLLENFDGKNSITRCLVVFSGAVHKRESKMGPFFSGRKLSGKVSIPTICISDPTLELDDQLSIGWYAGYRGRTDIRSEVASVLNDFGERFGCEFMIIGGSAGGFAALNISPLINAKCCILAFNPQTDISRYWPSHVSRYLSVASGLRVEIASPREAAAIFGDLEIKPDLSYEDLEATEHRILYVQNAHDNHVSKHLKPFIRNGHFSETNKNTFISARGGINVWIGDWGDGHAPLPGEDVIALVELWKTGGGPQEWIEALAVRHAHDEAVI
ncbi:MAG: hypothetical protein ACK46Q_08560 [Hyphomonas sp.]